MGRIPTGSIQAEELIKDYGFWIFIFLLIIAGFIFSFF